MLIAWGDLAVSKKYRKNSITTKIFVTLIILILPFNIISLIIAGYSIRNARLEALQSVKNISSLNSQQLENRLSTMNEFYYNLEQVRDDFKLYKGQGERNGELILAEVSLARYFNATVENDAFSDALFWHSKSYDKFYIGLDGLSNKKCIRNAECKAMLREFLLTDEKDSYSKWKLLEIEETQWLLKIYTENDFYYGSLISLDELAYQVEQGSTYSGVTVRFYSKDADVTCPAGYMESSHTVQYADLQMQVLVPLSQGYNNLSVIQILCMILAGLYILLIPFLIVFIHRMILQPLGKIQNAMKHIQHGDQDYRIEVGRESEEFVEIDESFNDMADRIHDLKIENYEKELEKKQVELRNLQLQIRPHFLMNMFNLLYSFAQIENYQSIQKLALYLSDYFRYIFQSGRELQPFSKEYELIQQYLEISAMRYPHCVETVCEIEPEALEVEIPPLLIHNFVENIFKHIVTYDKVIHLRLEAYTDETEATFIISDDGPGMPAEMVEDINKGVFVKKENDRVHVGIENSYRRIHYFYGEKASINVESELGEGTCFTIVIPMSEKK